MSHKSDLTNKVEEEFKMKCLLHKDMEVEMTLSDNNNFISKNGDHIKFNICINDSYTLYKLILYNITKKYTIYNNMYSMNNNIFTNKRHIDENIREVFDSLDNYLLLDNLTE